MFLFNKKFDCSLQGKDGLTPSRQSASTLAQSTTVSSSVGSLGVSRPSGGSGIQDFGQEQEVYSLLIIDQNTFEVLHAHQLMQQVIYILDSQVVSRGGS